jgi:tetrahydromethanopterin S-methyltransferase subunit E
MITLFASIAGFFSSLFPEILRLIKDKNDQQHQLAMMELQITMAKSKNAALVQQLEQKASTLERASLYGTYKTEITWIDALNGSVRPILAYSFFIMYLSIKIMQYVSLKDHSHTPLEHLALLWSLEDQAIFASIISFYFGQRTLSKLWRAKNS